MSKIRTDWLIGWAVLAFVVGCGEPAGRHHMSGQVTYGGQPVVYAMIYFNPDVSKGGRGPQGAGEVRNGQFHTNQDYGPVKGPHIVRIIGWGQGPEQGMLGPPLFTYEKQMEIPDSIANLDFDVPVTPAPPPAQ